MLMVCSRGYGSASLVEVLNRQAQLEVPAARAAQGMTEHLWNREHSRQVFNPSRIQALEAESAKPMSPKRGRPNPKPQKTTAQKRSKHAEQAGRKAPAAEGKVDFSRPKQS